MTIPIPRGTGRSGAWLSAASLSVVLLFPGCDAGGSAGVRTADGAIDGAARGVLRHHLGVVLVSADDPYRVEHAFRVPNPSPDRPMKLRLESRSCACTASEAFPAVVPPGDSAEVAVGFDVTGVDGEQGQTVVYSTGLEDVPEVRLQLAVTVRNRLRFESVGDAAIRLRPDEVREIGLTVLSHASVDEGPAEVSLSAGPRPVDPPLCEVVDSYPLAEAAVAGPDGSTLRMRKTHFVCRVYGDGAGERTWATPTVGIPLTASTGGATAELLLTLRAAPFILARPPTVLFFDAAPGAVRSVTLVAETPFRVLSVVGNGTCVAVDTPDGPATEQRITLRSVGPDVDRGRSLASRDVLTVYTDHPRQKAVRIPVSVLNPVKSDPAPPELRRPLVAPRPA